MVRQYHALVAVLSVAAFGACSYDPKVDANGFKCHENRDCPSGYRCVKAAGETVGVCCNRADPLLCLASGKDAAAEAGKPRFDASSGDVRWSEVASRLDGAGAVDGVGATAEVGPPPDAPSSPDAPLTTRPDLGVDIIDLDGAAGSPFAETGLDVSADAPGILQEVSADLLPMADGPPDQSQDAPSDATTSNLGALKTGSGSGTITSSPTGINCGGTCAADFVSGTMVTLTAAADATSAFTGWSGACSGTDACTVTVDAAKSVTATFDIVQHGISVSKTGTGGGAVTSAPGGIVCGGTCSATFTTAAVVTLTAAADGTSTFTGWSGVCSGTGTCVVTVDAAKSVTANFDLVQYALTAGKTGAGGGTITSSPIGIACGATCSASFTTGSLVTLTPAADGTSIFTGWSGACSGTATCTVTVDAAKSATANFDVVQNGINIAKTGTGGGTVTSSPAGISCGGTCSYTFNAGTSVTLTAVSDGTSTFIGWSGSCAGAGTCTVAADAAKSVTANFDLIQFGLTVAKGGTGGGTVTSSPTGINCGSTCAGNFTTGAVVNLTAATDATSTFTGWSGACAGLGSCSVTMSAAKTVTANFDVIQYTVTAGKSGTGSGTVTSSPAGISCGATCGASFNIGTLVTFSANPDATSTFTGWTGACSGPGACSITADAAKSVTATFMKAAGSGCGVGTECASGNCLDGVCCTQPTCPQCQNCGASGACSVTVANADDTTGATCSGTNTCDGSGACRTKPGLTCGSGAECASGNCLDGVCCTQSSCPQCRNCGSDGTCSVTVSSADDTTGATCTGNHTTCSAAGACVCASGYSGSPPSCVLADPCMPDPCNGHGTCSAGACTCSFGFASTTCSQCDTGYSGYPSCAAGPWVQKWKQVGETSTSYLGAGGVSYGPDANGDGIGDVLVGAPYMNSDTGTVYLYSGKDGSLLQSWSGEASSGNFGNSVSLGPDVTGDGLADVLISAPTLAIGGNSQVGKVYLYNGATGAFIRSWPGTITNANFGYSVSLGPDTNGDGRGDVLIGMINGVAGNAGQAFLYSGKDGTLLNTFPGPEINARFGGVVFLGADVTGDGRGDLLVTESMATVSGMALAGKVYLYSGASGALLKTWSGEAAGDRFGIALSMGPDADGDGKPDVAIGTSIAHDGTSANVGKAYVYSSSSGSLIRSWKGPYAGARFGYGISLGPDADGDGLGDLLVGSDSKNFAALFSSATGQMLNLWTGATNSGFGQSLWLGPSINGDSKPEVAIAAGSDSSGQGSVFFYNSNRGACAADCTGKCGGASDGCGGTCSTVPSGSVCSQQFLIPDPCIPDPCNGHGSCSLGACTCSAGFAGITCNACDAGYQTYPTCSPMCSSATPIDIAPSYPAAYHPAVVWNGTEWGAMYRDTLGGAGYKLHFSRLDATGAKKAGSEVVVTTAADYPSIAWSSAYGRYGAVWVASNNVYFACLDTSGAIVGAAQQVSPSGSVGSSTPRITSQGSNFGIVWDDFSSGKRQVYFVRYSPNTCTVLGSITKVSPVSTNVSGGPDVVYASSEYGVAWYYQDSSTLKIYLMFSRVDQNSAKVPGSDITITEFIGGGGSPNPRIDWSATNSQYGIAFVQGDIKIAFARVNSSGTQVGSPIVYSSDSVTLNSGPNIVAGSSRWGLTWTENSGAGRFMRIDNTGVKVSPVMPMGGYGPYVGWDGTAFLYVYPPGTGTDLYTARITCP